MLNGPSDPWLPLFKGQSNGSHQLFCFPYAGGDARVFASWSASLPSSVRVCPVELPGRGARLRDSPLRDLERISDAAAEAIEGSVTGPFGIFGHSMGAVVGFEVARRLRDRGRLPACVIASAHRAPQLSPLGEPLHEKSDAALVEELARMNGTPRELLEDGPMMELFLPNFRADLEACERYRYSAAPPLDCPVLAFGGLRDPGVPRGALLAWGAQTRASFMIRMFPGDHFFLHSARDLVLRELARELTLIFGRPLTPPDRR